ncbi:MAG: DUF547 domain-containing protein [Flavobacteriaceae bacterium]
MMKKNLIVTLFMFLILAVSTAQGTSEFFSRSDSFFKAYVKNGRVDYKAIKNNTAALDDLLVMAKGISVAKENMNEYQAFWINGYNLAVIKGIIDNYPLKSPLDKAGFFDKTKYDIGGESITLNDIENILLRKNFPKEPRFHFVLVCGGLGCPPIISQAYLPATLNDQLEKQAKLALNDPKFIQVDKGKVKISQIFEWYKSDFENDGSVVDYINAHRSEQLPEKAKVSYYPYDWTLNDLK